MSEQSLTNFEQQVPKFTDLNTQDWGQEVVPSPAAEEVKTETTATEVPRETEAASESDPSFEVARSRGWVPKEEWKGAEDRWVDANAFNERYESVLPVVQRENKKLNEKLTQQQQELLELRRQAQEWQKDREEQQKTQRQIRIDTLNMERKRAIENGDTDALMRVDDELMDLRVTAKLAPTRQVTPDQVDPASAMSLSSFLADYPQFKDPKLGAVLAEQATLMRQAGSTLKYRDFLDEAKERVERMYPERFRAAPQRRHPMAETAGAPSGSRAGSGRTWNDLLPEVREAADKFIKTTPGSTREGWLKSATDEYFRR